MCVMRDEACLAENRSDTMRHGMSFLGWMSTPNLSVLCHTAGQKLTSLERTHTGRITDTGKRCEHLRWGGCKML